MFSVRSSRALACTPRALLARRTNATLSDAKHGKAPLPNTPEGERILHMHEPPVHPEEGFSKGFYVSIAAVVGVLALYKFEQSVSGNKANPITRAIEYYGDLSKDWEERNSRHTLMVERAAADRSLFQDSKSSGTVSLKFPERFNTGSPYNNEVGWQGNDLAALVAHYEAERKEKEQRRVV